MSAFTALNIEPDEHPDDEVDNTKELQIEEALKLYQNALKLHSQGPEYFEQAAQAYSLLLASEIFRYPESFTEFTRIYTNPELEWMDPSLSMELAQIGGISELPPSTLPQILYLANKNYGQFILDEKKAQLQDPDFAASETARVALRDHLPHALDAFSKAIAWDESDTELWRRASRVAGYAGSRRMERFCLEAALEVDDDPTVAEVEPSNIEEAFAGEQLKQHLDVIGDEFALQHPIMGPFKDRTMAPFMTKRMDPYPFLTKSTGAQFEFPTQIQQNYGRSLINVLDCSWTTLGKTLFGASLTPPGLASAGVHLNVPQPTPQPSEDAGGEDQVMADVVVAVSPAAQSSESPSVTPVIAKTDEPAVEAGTAEQPQLQPQDDEAEKTTDLPSRKRSQSAAGLPDTPEEENGMQKRSKRIRNRDTNAFEVPTVDAATHIAEQLEAAAQADEHVFELVGGFLKRIGVDDLGKLEDLQTALAKQTPTDREDALRNTAVRDLRDILCTWDEAKASTFVNCVAADILGSSTGGANAGLAAFLEHSKTGPQKLSVVPPYDETGGLTEFIDAVNGDDKPPLQDVVVKWLLHVLMTYKEYQWSENLKHTVVQMISTLDADIYDYVRRSSELPNTPIDDEKLGLLTEALFELHLDIYSSITNPSSIVSFDFRLTTKDRLDRWADLATSVIRSQLDELSDELKYRYLWASVFYATMADEVSREQKISFWSDLQELLGSSENPVAIELPNNAVMPEISSVGAEREVSRLTSMEFFYNLFQTDKTDPLAIIDTLEPVLDPESACAPAESEAEALIAPQEIMESTPAALREMWKFLKSGSTSLRLYLWQRLREAYHSIGYTTKVFSCHLKTIEIIVADFRNEDFVDSADEPRRHKLLVWLKALDDLLVKALTIALNDASTCFEIIDERHLKSTCTALAQLNRVLHAAAVFDDEVRVGSKVLSAMSPAYTSQGSFSGFINKLREMQVRAWALQYTMIKEATNQFCELFPTKDKDLADYLAGVHYQIGIRRFCKASNKIFLKMMKVEMIRLKHVDNWEDYQGQVLYDLYGIRLGFGTYMLQDHGCPTENLDRRTVMNIADQVIALASQMPMKDLLKHELKLTIDKMQTAIGKAKETPQMQHNLRNYTEYLRTSIHPINMYKALKGQVQVDSLPVVSPESPLAEKGWYFLMGMLALTKFRTQKRLGPGAQTDDLKVGATFLKLQLQFSADHWETWYRLAQCFDYELEEEVLWGADKINNHRSDLVRLQRSAIHCYVMALSTAMRTADSTFETANKLSEMYYDFGMRIYASSREPFGMEAFWVDDFEKHMSGASGMYKKVLHEEMTRYRVWAYASELFRLSLQDRPNFWMNHFMLGKCQWKMFTKVTDEWVPREGSRPTVDKIIKCFVKAAEAAPKRIDSRTEPVLEAYYKVISTVHKLVVRGDLELQAATDILQDQPFPARNGDHVTISDHAAWDAFVLESLKVLRALDRQHWHHRMISRVVNILYDESHPDYVKASAARNEWRESIFTKTMHIQVWKPDAERPGRHCVYMHRYVITMARILWVLNDKPNMELLTKRVRKKAVDFYRFSEVWTECCSIYLRMIRKFAEIPPNVDEVFKTISHEEFEIFSDRLNAWVADPTVSHPALDALRETVELKKTNANAMKSTPIDDMINDIWAVLYTQVGKSLPGPEGQSTQQAQLDGTADSRPPGPMNLNQIMNMDGSSAPNLTPIEPPRTRKVGVSRREILRRAELAVSRIPEARAAASSARPRVSDAPRNLTLGSNASPPPSQTRAEPLSTPAGLMREDEESTRGSDADDESDLSDVPDMDDEQEQRMMFPNLMRRENGSGHGSSGARTPVG